MTEITPALSLSYTSVTVVPMEPRQRKVLGLLIRIENSEDVGDAK